MVGVLLEDGNLLLFILVIFFWKLFKVKRYVWVVVCVGYFWVWCLFCIISVFLVLYVDIVYGKDKMGNINVNVVVFIIEMFFFILFVSVINFIVYEIYVKWVEDWFWD